jgi:hypothetical protein
MDDIAIELVKAYENVYGISEEKNPEKYAVTINCENCGDSKYYFIPKNITKENYLKNEMCVVCGCNVINEKYKWIKGKVNNE